MFIPTSTNTMDHNMKCMYSNGRGCDAQRAMKMDGSLHRFCVRHRDEALVNQRNYIQRRRERIGVTNAQTNGANADPTSSTFRPINVSQPGQVEAVLAIFGRQDLVNEVVENSSDGGSSEGLTATTFVSLGNIPSNEQLRLLMDDLCDESNNVLRARCAPWLPQFISEAYESVMADP
jgi:hypothetical protein